MEQQVKHRIIGIVVLVLLMVIFAPLLFKGTKQRVLAPKMVTTIPLQPVKPVLTQIDVVHNKLVQQVQSFPSPKALPVVTTKPIVLKPTAKTKAKAKALLAHWIIQAGSFSRQNNAEKLVRNLKQRGFAAYRRQIRARRTIAHRVFIAPNKKWPHSLRALVALRKQFKIDGILIRK